MRYRPLFLRQINYNNLRLRIVPGTGEVETIFASFAKVRSLKQRIPGLTIVAFLDFAAEERIYQATGRPQASVER